MGLREDLERLKKIRAHRGLRHYGASVCGVSTARLPADGAGLSVSARRRANGFAQSLFLWVLRRELGDFVAYGGVGGGRGCLTTTTHVKMGERRSGMEWAPRCLLP